MKNFWLKKKDCKFHKGFPTESCNGLDQMASGTWDDEFPEAYVRSPIPHQYYNHSHLFSVNNIDTNSGNAAI